MYEELGNVKEPVALTPQEALDSAVALLVQQGYSIAQRTGAVVTAERRKKSGMCGQVSLYVAVGVRELPEGGVQIKLRGNDREGVRDRQAEWSRWAESLPKLDREQREHEGTDRPETTETRTGESETRAGREATDSSSGDDQHERQGDGDPPEPETQTETAGDLEESGGAAAQHR